MNESEPPAPAIQVETAPSLEELFSRDPNDWTDPDIENIVHTLRAQRTKFNAVEGIKQIEGKKPKATKLPTAKTPALEKPAGEKISLADLDLFD